MSYYYWFPLADFICAIKLSVRWAEYVACVGDMRKVHQRVVGKIKEKRIHAWTKHIWYTIGYCNWSKPNAMWICGQVSTGLYWDVMFFCELWCKFVCYVCAHKCRKTVKYFVYVQGL